jgi:hypothetical protein
MFFRKKDKATEFWKWFTENKSALETFITQNNRDYSIYKKLTAKMHKFNKQIFPEITVDNGMFVLILTPDGIKDGIEPVKELFNKAPKFENWIVKKFRQANDNAQLSFNGLEFKQDAIKIWRAFDLEQGSVDIAILIKDYSNDDPRFKNLAFLYLDHVLGEFNVLTVVGQIDFLGWNMLNSETEAIDLITLRQEIEKKLY